ncbi:MAG: hypothetical protein AMK69_26000, partial [Nitrospira bacterium SG8_3]
AFCPTFFFEKFNGSPLDTRFLEWPLQFYGHLKIDTPKTKIRVRIIHLSRDDVSKNRGARN